MGRWLTFLEKAGLVELSPAEQARLERQKAVAAQSQAGDTSSEQSIDDLLAETSALTSSLASSSSSPPTAPPAPAPPPLPPADAKPLTEGELFAGRELDEIYATANVPQSPFPAEKLLRVLDGLQAMDEPMRRAAIDAMDAADETWTLGDPLVDAQRKVRVLDGELIRLQTAQGDAETTAASELEAQDAYQAQATQTIRDQIAELEAMLETELRTVADERARIQRELDETRAAIQRESTRYQGEIARLQTLVRAFPDTHS